MEKSQSIKHIAEALSKFHSLMGKVNKDASNPFFNSKYASLPNILESIKQPLLDSGLSFTQFPTGNFGLTTVLMHGETGEYMQTEYFMQPTKTDPQAAGSAISYMRRYALGAVLGLNLDADDDANAATHGASKPNGGQKGNQQPNPQQQNTGAAQPAQAAQNPWLDEGTKTYEKILARLQEKTTTLAEIEKHFKLNKTVRKKLQDFIASLKEAPAAKETPVIPSASSDTPYGEAMAQWQEAIDQCKTEPELRRLWEGNKETCEASNDLPGMFSKRSQAIARGDVKPWLDLDTDVYKQIVTRIKNKTTTIDVIAQHYKLSMQVRAALQEVINELGKTA